VDLAAMLKLLAGRGITRLMVEGGPMLADALINADLIDAAVLFHAPTIVGPEGIDALAAPSMAALTQTLPRTTSELVGTDRQDIYERQ
jgi:diaminohydroxyphosphoribosylaminopyrimidine deaminase/5-amino-6-(5-phosphoribosylamino)uracil reductase